MEFLEPEYSAFPPGYVSSTGPPPGNAGPMVYTYNQAGTRVWDFLITGRQ